MLVAEEAVEEAPAEEEAVEAEEVAEEAPAEEEPKQDSSDDEKSSIDIDLICVGSIGKPRGLKGEFFLNSFCDPKTEYLQLFKFHY